MSTKGIQFSLTPVSTEFTGGAKVFRANVKTNGTVDAEQLANEAAESLKIPVAFTRYLVNVLTSQLNKEWRAGNRVNLGQAQTGFVIKGSFTHEDDRFDHERHALALTIHPLGELKSALADITPENIQVSLVCSVYSLMDAVTKETNVITGTNEQHIQGENLGIDPDNADEGVTLVDADGNTVATATVSASDAQTITCTFPAVEAGEYTLVVSARNGSRTSLAPAVARLKVTVKAA